MYIPKKDDIWVQHENGCNSKDIPEGRRGAYLDANLCGCKDIVWHQFIEGKWNIVKSIKDK